VKKIHVAGTALAGVLAVGAFQGKGLQSNATGTTGGATAAAASTAPSPAAPGTNTVAPLAPQQSGQFNFGDDQAPINDLQLRPDQSVPTWVRIIFKEVEKPKADDGKTQQTAGKGAPQSGTDKKKAAKKNGGAKKKGAAKKTNAPDGKANPKNEVANNPPTSGKGTSTPLKFNLDMTPSGFSPCTTTVATLVAESAWKLNDRRGIPISITSCSPDGGEGKLTIADSTGQRRELTVKLQARRSTWLHAATIASLGLAVLLSLSCAVIVLLHGHKMSDRIGQASWDFSSSWASNITAFGTGATFLLGFTLFPDKPFFGTKLEYSFLAAFATAAAAFAPAIHRMMSAPAANQSANEGATPAAEGLVGGFLTASAFTIWGALLQTAVELLIVWELAKTVTIYHPIGVVVAIAIGLTGIGLIVYSVTTILSTIGGNASRSGKGIGKRRLNMLSATAPKKEEAAKRTISVL